MKSIIALLSLITVSFSEIPQLSCDFETGYIPSWSSAVFQLPDEYRFVGSKNTFYVSCYPRIEFIGIYAELGITYFANRYKKDIQFIPHRWLATGEVGYNFKFITVGYNNMCNHTIHALVNYEIEDKKFIDGGYSKFFIRVQISNHPKK